MSNVAIYLNAKNDMKQKDSDSYGTPNWLFDYLDREYDFDIDLCASDVNKKCANFFTIEDDALSKNWHEHGAVGFCNPPFSYGKKEKFLKKAFEEMIEHGFSTVFIIPADVANKAWADLIIGKATNIKIISGRVKFDVPHMPGVDSKGGIGVAIVEFMAHEPHTRALEFADRDTIKSEFS